MYSLVFYSSHYSYSFSMESNPKVIQNKKKPITNYRFYNELA